MKIFSNRKLISSIFQQIDILNSEKRELHQQIRLLQDENTSNHHEIMVLVSTEKYFIDLQNFDFYRDSSNH